jgi:hypothetical protein
MIKILYKKRLHKETRHESGITRIEQLKTAHPETLFHLLETKSGYKQNICMLDLFHAIIHEAQTGERMPWHYFSALRRKNL